MGFKPPKKEKGAKLKEPPEASKPIDKEHLTISLRYISKSHCISACDAVEQGSFVEKVRILTAMSWLDIGMESAHGLGYEKIPRKQIKVAIPKHITDDVNLLSFRFNGKKPMIGYKDGETFHILWFDRVFDVYGH